MRDNCECDVKQDYVSSEMTTTSYLCEGDSIGKKEAPSATTAVYGHEKAREVSIEQLDYGYRVRVGCQVFALQELSTVLSLLAEYLKSPGEVETKWCKGELKFN